MNGTVFSALDSFVMSIWDFWYKKLRYRDIMRGTLWDMPLISFWDFRY